MVSIPHRYDKNTWDYKEIILSIFIVSIPHRYDKNMVRESQSQRRSKVSIPHRYDKNDTKI